MKEKIIYRIIVDVNGEQHIQTTWYMNEQYPLDKIRDDRNIYKVLYGDDAVPLLQKDIVVIEV